MVWVLLTSDCFCPKRSCRCCWCNMVRKSIRYFLQFLNSFRKADVHCFRILVKKVPILESMCYNRKVFWCLDKSGIRVKIQFSWTIYYYIFVLFTRGYQTDFCPRVHEDTSYFIASRRILAFSINGSKFCNNVLFPCFIVLNKIPCHHEWIRFIHASLYGVAYVRSRVVNSS